MNQVFEWLVSSTKVRIIWKNPNLIHGWNNVWPDFTYLSAELQIIKFPFLWELDRRVNTKKNEHAWCFFLKFRLSIVLRFIVYIMFRTSDHLITLLTLGIAT
jgi:hypothetical protein